MGACQSLKVSSKSDSPEKSFTSYGRGQKSWGADVQRQKNGTRNVDGTKFAAHQSVLLGSLSIPESFVKIEQSRKKFYFIRKGSKKAGAPIFNGPKMALGTLMG